MPVFGHGTAVRTISAVKSLARLRKIDLFKSPSVNRADDMLVSILEIPKCRVGIPTSLQFGPDLRNIGLFAPGIEDISGHRKLMNVIRNRITDVSIVQKGRRCIDHLSKSKTRRLRRRKLAENRGIGKNIAHDVVFSSFSCSLRDCS